MDIEDIPQIGIKDMTVLGQFGALLAQCLDETLIDLSDGIYLFFTDDNTGKENE